MRINAAARSALKERARLFVQALEHEDDRAVQEALGRLLGAFHDPEGIYAHPDQKERQEAPRGLADRVRGRS